MAPETIQALEAFDWPGNVRELRNAMERAVLLAGQEELLPSDLPPEVTGGVRDGAGATALEGVPSLPQEGCEIQILLAPAIRFSVSAASRSAPVPESV